MIAEEQRNQPVHRSTSCIFLLVSCNNCSLASDPCVISASPPLSPFRRSHDLSQECEHFRKLIDHKGPNLPRLCREGGGLSQKCLTIGSLGIEAEISTKVLFKKTGAPYEPRSFPHLRLWSTPSRKTPHVTSHPCHATVRTRHCGSAAVGVDHKPSV